MSLSPTNFPWASAHIQISWIEQSSNEGILTFQSRVVTSLLSFMLGKWFNTMGSAVRSLPSGTSHNLAVASPELKSIYVYVYRQYAPMSMVYSYADNYPDARSDDTTGFQAHENTSLWWPWRITTSSGLISVLFG